MFSSIATADQENLLDNEVTDYLESEFSLGNDEILLAAEEHTKNRRPSNLSKHQKGTTRKGKDRGGERGDKKRRVPRVKPPKWKGPWPPASVPIIVPFDLDLLIDPMREQRRQIETCGGLGCTV